MWRARLNWRLSRVVIFPLPSPSHPSSLTFPLPSLSLPLFALPLPLENPRRQRRPRGRISLHPRGQKMSFFFSFSFGLLIQMISSSFAHEQRPRHLRRGHYGRGPVEATTSVRRATLTWRPRQGVVRETRRLGLGRHVTRHATPRRPMNAGHLASPKSSPRPTIRGSLARPPGLARPDPAHSYPARPTLATSACTSTLHATVNTPCRVARR